MNEDKCVDKEKGRSEKENLPSLTSKDKQKFPSRRGDIKSVRFFVFLSLCFPVLLLCAQAQVESIGITSYIEDFPQPFNDEGPYRQIPFVEVIHKELLEECKAQGFDQALCPEFEWSVPFIPADVATETEDIIAAQWFRFETRSYWRAQLEIGGVNPLLACTVGGLDLLWFFYSGDLFFPAADFCDDFTAGIVPNCFFSCDVPPAFCPHVRPECMACFEEGFARAVEHATTVYYLEYQKVVLEQMLVLSGLGALWWSDDPLLLEGALIASVTDPLNHLLWLEDVVAILIPQGLGLDLRAATYYTQTAASNEACQDTLLVGSTQGLIELPTEHINPEAPGIVALEELKRLLADRESAGDTWKRTLQLFTDPNALNPKYRKESFEPSAMGTSTPTAHACLGQNTFIELFQKEELVSPLHRPVQRLTFCWIGVTVVPALPQYFIFALPRWHSDWVSVPEGYEIPRVKGEPKRISDE